MLVTALVLILIALLIQFTVGLQTPAGIIIFVLVVLMAIGWHTGGHSLLGL